MTARIPFPAPRSVASLVAFLVVGLVPSAAEAQGGPPADTATAADVARAGTADVPAPEPGALTSGSVHEGEHVVVRILRLAPGAVVGEHHHPGHDESFVVQAGRVSLRVGETTHELAAGDVLFIPAGSVISGRSCGPEEAVVVVTWASRGEAGPLTVPGRPAQVRVRPPPPVVSSTRSTER